MTMMLSAAETRVLGALVEKETTTPEYYPLSLNALVNACNQRSNREPVMELTEDEVRSALRGLEDDGLAGVARGAEGRVTKYEHRVQEVFNFTRGETAVLCVLLLRGAQTPGELRGRTERMYRFEELEDVLAVLQKLMQWEPPLVAALPRQPGTKEVRYAQLLSGSVHPVRDETVNQDGTPARESAREERLRLLEAEVARLREEVVELRATIEDMKAEEGHPSGAKAQGM